MTTDPLFQPFTLVNLTLRNRIVMAPMTRSKSPHGVPGENVAAYYRRRAEGGVGLIVTEGTSIPHPAAVFYPDVPRFYGEDALAGWKRVVDEVHQAGGLIFPQLWHVGVMRDPSHPLPAGVEPMSPSGLRLPGEKSGVAMTQADIDAVIEAYGQAARSAKKLGFDGIEIHGAHGYLIDQFLWEGTNQRTDRYGGSIVARTTFAVEVLREVRRAVGPGYPVVLRFSQWKLQDYAAKLATTPQELEKLLNPLVAAGADAFHCSSRRFWDTEFEGSTLNLAGWTKKLTGMPTITVGSVTLNEEFMTTFQSAEGASVTGLDELIERLGRGEFDLVALGRALIVNPSWPEQVRRGKLDELRPFHKDALATLA
jgi:2,4-dienoyl-CoA reductase-like NADH-dependent reductase (Old Yellow Enzyme family)